MFEIRIRTTVLAFVVLLLTSVSAFAQSPQSITFTTQAPTSSANNSSFTVAAAKMASLASMTQFAPFTVFTGLPLEDSCGHCEWWR